MVARTARVQLHPDGQLHVGHVGAHTRRRLRVEQQRLLGTYVSSGFKKTPGETCDACCVTESSFYVYNDFELTFEDDDYSGDGYYEAYSAGINPLTETDQLFAVGIDVGNVDYVNEDDVCCFWYARDASTADVLVDDDDAFADRIVDTSTFHARAPRTRTIRSAAPATPCSSPKPWSAATRQACPCPQTLTTREDPVTSTDLHGVSAASPWTDLEGLDFYARPCPLGYYTEAYDEMCLPCPLGTKDDRTSDTYNQLTDCTVCSAGYYQDEWAKPCASRVRAGTVKSTRFSFRPLSTRTVTRSRGKSHGTRACASRISGRDPNANCDIEGECCSACPTGGTCDGGFSSKVPQSDLYTNVYTQRTRFYDFSSGNPSDWYYQLMPYAARGYWRIPGDEEGVIEQCAPKPSSDDDSSGDPGACEGGEDADPTYQYENVCATGYAGYLCPSATPRTTRTARFASSARRRTRLCWPSWR